MKAKLLQNYKINMMRDLVCSSAGRDVIILYAYISYLILYPISIYMWDFTAGAIIAPAHNGSEHTKSGKKALFPSSILSSQIYMKMYPTLF